MKKGESGNGRYASNCIAQERDASCGRQEGAIVKRTKPVCRQAGIVLPLNR